MKRVYIKVLMMPLVLTQVGCGSSSSQITPQQQTMLNICASQPLCMNQASACAVSPTSAACIYPGGIVPASNSGYVLVPALTAGGTTTTQSVNSAATGLPAVPATPSLASLRSAGSGFNAQSIVDSQNKPNFENLVQGVNNVVGGQSSVRQAEEAYQAASGASSSGSGASQ